jgi:hypothetical protein
MVVSSRAEMCTIMHDFLREEGFIVNRSIWSVYIYNSETCSLVDLPPRDVQKSFLSDSVAVAKIVVPEEPARLLVQIKQSDTIRRMIWDLYPPDSLKRLLHLLRRAVENSKMREDQTLTDNS